MNNFIYPNSPNSKGKTIQKGDYVICCDEYIINERINGFNGPYTHILQNGDWYQVIDRKNYMVRVKGIGSMNISFWDSYKTRREKEWFCETRFKKPTDLQLCQRLETLKEGDICMAITTKSQTVESGSSLEVKIEEGKLYMVGKLNIREVRHNPSDNYYISVYIEKYSKIHKLFHNDDNYQRFDEFPRNCFVKLISDVDKIKYRKEIQEIKDQISVSKYIFQKSLTNIPYDHPLYPKKVSK